MKFKKIVKYSPADLVNVEIVEVATGRRVSSDFFMSLFDSQEKKFQKAHAWADKQIEILEKYTED